MYSCLWRKVIGSKYKPTKHKEADWSIRDSTASSSKASTVSTMYLSIDDQSCCPFSIVLLTFILFKRPFVTDLHPLLIHIYNKKLSSRSRSSSTWNPYYKNSFTNPPAKSKNALYDNIQVFNIIPQLPSLLNQIISVSTIKTIPNLLVEFA
jgi:hypothetical protein